jgi:hypothetical protein
VDVVRDDHREADLGGEKGGFGDEPVVVGQKMVLKLEEEAAEAGNATRAGGAWDATERRD